MISLGPPANHHLGQHFKANSKIDLLGRPQSRLVVITIFTHVVPKLQYQAEITVGWPSLSLMNLVLFPIKFFLLICVTCNIFGPVICEK